MTKKEKLQKIVMGTFYSPDEKRRARAELKHMAVGSRLSSTAKEELKLMKKAIKSDPFSEPEPTYRFDYISADEREYIAKELS